MWNKLSSYLPESKLLRNVMTLAGGTAVAQIVTVLAMPVLSRLYDPGDFGVLAVYTSIVGLVVVAATFRYEMAIPMSEDEEGAVNVVALSILILFGVTFSASIIVLLFGESLVNKLNTPALSTYLWLLPLGVFLGGLYNILNYWSVRAKRFTSIANARIGQSISSVAVQVVGSGIGGISLTLGAVFGQGVSSFQLARRSLTDFPVKAVSRASIRQVAIRYKDFPIFSSAAGLVSAIGLQAAPLIIAASVGPAAAGLYALANRVVTLPGAMIGGAFGSVFFSEAPEAHRADRLGVLVEQLYGRLSMIAAPVSVFLILFGPEAFAFVFGEEWRNSGQFAQWLALPLYASFVTAPLSTVFAVVEKQKIGLIMQSQLVLLRLVPLITGIGLGGLELGIACFAVGSLIGYAAYTLVSFRVARVNPFTIVERVLVDSVFALACFSPFATGFYYAENLVLIVFSGLISLFLLFIYLKRIIEMPEKYHPS